jgi:sister chromatid cohesion protein DCC1
LYGIQAISSTGVTLELSQSTESALPYLRKALLIYSSRDLNAAAAVKSSFETVCRDIPLSNGEVQDAWSMLCAFEEQGASYRPTANILLQLWKAITTTAFAEDLDLSKAFLVEDLWTAIKDEEYPRGMFDVFLYRVEDRNSMDVDANSKCKSRLLLRTEPGIDAKLLGRVYDR